MKNFIASMLIVVVVAFSANASAVQRSESDFDYRIPFFYGRISNCQQFVSLRYAPDVYSECIIEIPLGATVSVKNRRPTSDFSAVTYRGQEGYVLSRYIRAIPWIECRNERDFVGAAYYAYVVNCRVAVSLRYAPDTAADCIIEIPLGTKVQVSDGPAGVTYNGFLAVRYNGHNGYVLADYLRTIPGSGGAPR